MMKQKQVDLREIEASLAYKVSSRIARARAGLSHRETLS